MTKYTEFVLEQFEEYYGNASQVIGIIENCNLCGSKLILTHTGNFHGLYLEENATCPDCGHKKITMVHSLN